MAAAVKPQVVPEGVQMGDDESEDGELRDVSPKPAESHATILLDKGGLGREAADEDGMEEGELELEEGEIAPESPPTVRTLYLSIASLVNPAAYTRLIACLPSPGIANCSCASALKQAHEKKQAMVQSDIQEGGSSLSKP